MSALGLSCNVRNGSIVVRGVLLTDDKVSKVFDHTTTRRDDLALQLRSLGDALATRLKAVAPTSVVVRTADHHSAAGRTETTVLRLRGEGVLLSTARAFADHVECLSGKAIGGTCDKSKADIDAHASQLLSQACKEATAAALAAERLRLNRSHG